MSLQVVDEHSTHSKLSDLDRIFLATNFEEDRKDVRGQVGEGGLGWREGGRHSEMQRNSGVTNQGNCNVSF